MFEIGLPLEARVVICRDLDTDPQRLPLRSSAGTCATGGINDDGCQK